MRTSWRWAWPTAETGWPSRATASTCRRCPGEPAPGHRWFPLEPESFPGSTTSATATPTPGQHPGPGRAAPARAVVQAAPAVLVGDGEPLVDVLEYLAAAEAVGQPVTAQPASHTPIITPQDGRSRRVVPGTAPTGGAKPRSLWRPGTRAPVARSWPGRRRWPLGFPRGRTSRRRPGGGPRAGVGGGGG